ncbi:hypothetical protein [Pseudolactococcus piscium]|uniref:hypothetical protein n=1 Tax=Pseudolactococcus piscium TaxID=1364 RepID=UPI000BDE894A|nr:hypothetical protein [Lactococcus piscium]
MIEEPKNEESNGTLISNIEGRKDDKKITTWSKTKTWYKKVNKKIVLFSAGFFVLGSFSTFLISHTINHSQRFERASLYRHGIDRYGIDRHGMDRHSMDRPKRNHKFHKENSNKERNNFD